MTIFNSVLEMTPTTATFGRSSNGLGGYTYTLYLETGKQLRVDHEQLQALDQKGWFLSPEKPQL